MKTFLLLVTKSPNARKFFSPSALCLCFVLFVFVSWPVEITAANLQRLIPEKVLTKSP